MIAREAVFASVFVRAQQDHNAKHYDSKRITRFRQEEPGVLFWEGFR